MSGSPRYVAIDAAGNAWVANNDSYSVTKFSPQGAILRTYAVVGGSPQGIAIDATGNACVANGKSNTVTKLGK